MDKLIPIYSIESFQQAFYLKQQLSREQITCFFSQKMLEDRKLITIEVKESQVEAAVTKIVELYKAHGMLPQRQRSSTHLILLAVNIYSYARSLLIYTLELAAKLNAEIKVLYVHRTRKDYKSYPTSSNHHSQEEDIATNRREVREKLGEFSNEFRELAKRQEYKNIEYSFCLIFGSPTRKILEISEQVEPDLLLTGCKNTKKNGDKIMGKVSLAVAENTRYPMLAVPREARYPQKNQLRILYATDFYKTDFEALESLISMTSSFQVKIFYVHIDLNGYSIARYSRKLSNLTNQLQQRFKDQQIEPHLIGNKNLFKGIQEFVDVYQINLIAFTSPRKSVFDKLLRPNQLKKMLYQSHIPLFIFKE